MKPSGLRRSERPMVWLFLFPMTAIYVLMFIFPSLRAFYISLFDWSGFTASMRYVGLGNFRELLGDDYFWSVAFVNTLKILFIGGAIIFAIAFLLSGVLSTNLRGKKIFRAITFFPTVLSPIAVAILWSFIYNDRWGLLNSTLKLLGQERLILTWMAPEHLFGSILAALVWMNTGFYCIILLAALDRIPQQTIESAYLDGAGEMQVFWRIKIPMIKDILATALTLWAINAVKEFGLLFAWAGGVDIPAAGATNLAVKMYVTAFGRRVTVYRMGYATAMGIVMFLLVALLVFLISRAFRSEVFEY